MKGSKQIRKNLLTWIIFLPLTMLLFTEIPAIAQDGATIFKTKCSSCHKIGGGRLVGPDLQDVSQRRKQEWLHQMIKDANTLIQDGDPVAKELQEEYLTVMPPQDLSNEEVEAVLAYIQSESADIVQPSATAGKQPAPPNDQTPDLSKATDADIREGRKLFTGEMTPINGGASCLSCHNVKDDKVTGGGLLARDLTTAWTRLGKQGVHSMIMNAPFPAMKEAFKGKDITEEEAFKLTAYLKHVDEERYYQHAPHYQARMLYTGVGGVIILLAVFGLLWYRRRKESVNDKIYKRQVKSQGEIKGLFQK